MAYISSNGTVAGNDDRAQMRARRTCVFARPAVALGKGLPAAVTEVRRVVTAGRAGWESRDGGYRMASRWGRPGVNAGG